MENFTFEEINLICCFKEKTKADTVANMTAIIPYMEQEIVELTKQTTQKLNELTEEEFTKFSFEPATDMK